MTFLAREAFGKLYTISTSDGGDVGSQLPYVLRLTRAPGPPRGKTAIEVATPTPRVITHSSTADNELGFEWIPMEKVPGIPLKSVWRKMDMATESETGRQGNTSSSSTTGAPLRD